MRAGTCARRRLPRRPDRSSNHEPRPRREPRKGTWAATSRRGLLEQQLRCAASFPPRLRRDLDGPRRQRPCPAQTFGRTDRGAKRAGREDPQTRRADRADRTDQPRRLLELAAPAASREPRRAYQARRSRRPRRATRSGATRSTDQTDPRDRADVNPDGRAHRVRQSAARALVGGVPTGDTDGKAQNVTRRPHVGATTTTIRQPCPLTEPGCTLGPTSLFNYDTLRGEDLDTNCVIRPDGGLSWGDRRSATSLASALRLTPKWPRPGT